ncbi:RNA polymerase-associated protein RapA [Sessilibacter sp. MAH4]
MSAPQYAIGQRWISNAEKELGLGVVIELKDRRVTVTYPACGEIRTYAERNAPLTRVKYEVGDTIYDLEDQAWQVQSITDHGHIIYSVKNSAGDADQLSEVELNPFVHFSGPLERLLAGNLDKPKHFQLRLNTLDHLQRIQSSGASGLIGARVDFLDHQMYIANEVANRYAPRVLLADEVGLGKTIEAGLIIHHQLINQRASRVLITLPDSLVHQWLVEMLRRFNLKFIVMSEERAEDIEGSEGINPFESAQLVISPLSMFTKNEERLNQACAAGWDILCVDEAHHLHWNEAGASDDYNAVEDLASCSQSLLLLTATPEQLGVESHFARLRLLDPDRYHSLEAYREEEQRYQPVNQIIQTLLEKGGAQTLVNDAKLQADLVEFVEPDMVKDLVAQIQSLDDEHEIEACIFAHVRELLDRHGTGRVLFRNTRSSVKGFPKRVLHTYPMALPEGWNAASLYPETQQYDSWLETDPRIPWLKQFLKERKQDKILLITANASTALDLEAHLRLRQGLRTSVFHEGMSLLERDRSAAYFADFEDGAQLLVCSEIGSEGRNFQFAHDLILFDLPGNPDLLEQRIGRLDRIGQTQDVQLHLPYFEGSSGQVLMHWLHEGINAFENTCAIGTAINEKFAEQVSACLKAPEDKAAVETLVSATAAYAQTLLSNLQQGRDRLLELNSCNPEKAQAVIEKIRAASSENELEDYMSAVFDQFGVEHQDHSEQTQILHPSESMHSPFPELPDEGISVCFNREKALSREELSFITWEHPMVTGAMEMITSGEHGNACLCTIKLPALPAGTWLLEANFLIHCPTPKAKQLSQFLPASSIRILSDQSGKDLSGVISSQQLTQLTKTLPLKQAQNVIQHLRDEIKSRTNASQKAVEKAAASKIKEAKDRLTAQQNYEIDRLKALAQVNPNIRQEEIDFLEAEKAELLGYLDQAQVRLDAIRILVLTE